LTGERSGQEEKEQKVQDVEDLPEGSAFGPIPYFFRTVENESRHSFFNSNGFTLGAI